jgi:hypothetical protein
LNKEMSMKKSIIVLAVLLALSSAAYADHPNKLGIGIVGGSGYGNGTIGSDIGLALKLQGMPIYWQLNVHLTEGYLGLGATGDLYFYDQNLLKEGAFKLDWFLGLGGYGNLGLGATATAAIGARMPVGLSWHITPQFELWLDVAPSLGVSVIPFEFPNWYLDGEVGFRVWM